MQFATNNFLAIACVYLTIFLVPSTTFAEDVKKAKFAYFGDTDSEHYLGILQGLNEANRQGRFLGQSYEIDTIGSDPSTKIDPSAYLAIMTDSSDVNFLIELANKYPTHPVFNLAVKNTNLRSACHANLLHIIPSNAMLEDSKKQWQKKSLDTPAKAQAWHKDFKKYAARDLNKRFLKKHKVPMSDASWAGWAAIKMTADSFARGKIQDAYQMLTFLKNKLSFDGQKGIDMNFRITGQLIQPILIIAEDKIVAEAPIRGVAKSMDSLGLLSCDK